VVEIQVHFKRVQGILFGGKLATGQGGIVRSKGALSAYLVAGPSLRVAAVA